MEQDIFERQIRLIGDAAMERLRTSHVAVFGIGGVGGYVAEALARSGIGELTLFDHDTVALSNLNRQIIALHSTIGRRKVDVMKERILDIAPETVVHANPVFFLPENADAIDFGAFDYVADAIDTVTGKIALILKAQGAGVPVISAMGAGNKMDPSAFRVADIYETKVCPLAKVMRKELKARGVKSCKVVYSEEEPVRIAGDPDPKTGKIAPGSNAFVPATCGLIMAGEIVRDLSGWTQA